MVTGRETGDGTVACKIKIEIEISGRVDQCNCLNGASDSHARILASGVRSTQ